MTTGLETTCYVLARNLSTFCPCLETLWEAKFKGDGLISLVEEISRQHSFQAVALVLLTAFSQIYKENPGQAAEQRGLENFQFDQNKSLCKVGEGIYGCRKD